MLSDWVQQAEGIATPCYVAKLLEETKGTDDEGVQGTAALVYSGGLDTVRAQQSLAHLGKVTHSCALARRYPQ